jgi:dihydrolipoamide dehydrogenase
VLLRLKPLTRRSTGLDYFSGPKGVRYLMRKNGITEYDGWGTFADDHTLCVARSDDESETLTFDHCVIATGATTRLLPGTRLSDSVVTYEEQILAEELPGSVVIVGGGAIGVEFACVLRAYGVDVTIVEYLDRVVPAEDAEVSTELAKQYRKLGITILTSTRVDAVDDTGPAGKVRVTVTRDGATEVLEADKVLQAIGFAPRVEGYVLRVMTLLTVPLAATWAGSCAVRGRW